jgi:hypothetical protein
MAFTSLSDARTKVTNPESEVNSIILYGNNNAFNSTTIFYTNVGLTNLAPAGNYVVVMNYLSYYVTLGSDGKMTSAPTQLMDTTTDTSWVDDDIHVRFGTNQRVNNQDGIGGTDLVLSNDLLLTDNVWTSRPYSNPKKWMIENTTIQSTAITNIDVSAMKGYDLRLVTGEWKNSPEGIAGFNGFTTSAIIHLAPEANRVTQVGSLKYYFKPDYWIPNILFDGPSYFRRMPNIIPLKDRYGIEKSWFDFYGSVNDLRYPTSTQLDRPTTRFEKGVTESTVKSWISVLNQSGFNRSESWEIIQPKKLHFDGDFVFRYCVAKAYRVPVGNVTFGSDLWNARIVALWESLLITDETERNTKVWNINGETITYSQCNPDKWTTERNSGISNQSDCPASQMEGYFYYIDGGSNGKRFEYDFEYVGLVGANSYNAGLAWSQCFTNAKNAIFPTEQPKGALVPKFSMYGQGLYQSTVYGNAGEGWSYATPGNNVSNFAPLYSNYHDYYVNGTKTYQQVTNTLAWFFATINEFRYSYICNYQNDMICNHLIYSIVHNYDISRKIYNEILGVGNDIRLCTYFWRNQEPLPASSDNGVVRRAQRPSGEIYVDSDNDKLEVCPSLMFNIALWGMAYADGCYFWDDAYTGEETIGFLDYLEGAFNKPFEDQKQDAIDQTYAIWGDAIVNSKGTLDWPYIAQFLLAQNKDIIEANTAWLVPDLSLGGGSFTTGTANYPVMLFNQSKPIARYKLSDDGTQALLLIHSGFNIGYTKETHTVRLPAKNNQQYTVDTWGNYTSVIRITL